MRRRFTSKRPPLLALGSIAATGLVLSGCGNEVPQEALYNSPAECVEAGFEEQICTAEYQNALRQHLRDAPRFDGLAACEAEVGEGRCLEAEGEAATGGGGSSFFLPFMTGYIMSSALRDFTSYRAYNDYRRRTSYTPTPIYRTRSGQTVTSVVTDGQRVSRPYNVNTRTVSRQGFGGRSSSRGFGFGG